MLNKCATKGCEQKFKYFGSGMLFLARDPRQTQEKTAAKQMEVEFYWLCEDCARKADPTLWQHLPTVFSPSVRRRPSI